MTIPKPIYRYLSCGQNIISAGAKVRFFVTQSSEITFFWQGFFNRKKKWITRFFALGGSTQFET